MIDFKPVYMSALELRVKFETLFTPMYSVVGHILEQFKKFLILAGTV